MHAGRAYLLGPASLTERDLADPRAPRLIGRHLQIYGRMAVGNDARRYRAGRNGIAVYAADRRLSGIMQ